VSLIVTVSNKEEFCKTFVWISSKNSASVVLSLVVSLETRGVTKTCRLSLLTNSALVIRVQMRGDGGGGGGCGVSAN
jgi:hypothetical protein